MKIILDVPDKTFWAIAKKHLEPSVLSADIFEKIKSIASKGNQWALIEATWSGYTSAQSRVVHREWRKLTDKNRDTLNKLDGYIYRFSDGTTNAYSVKFAMTIDRKIKENFGYRKITYKRIRGESLFFLDPIPVSETLMTSTPCS